MSEKSVWIVLCEGNTDRIFLSTYHDSTLSNLRMEIYSGDFLTDYKNNLCVSNVLEKITQKYSDIIEKLIMSKGIKIKDVSKIIYMTDTDNCFELDNNKAKLLKKLIYKEHLKLKSKEIDFQVLLMSSDLEHALYGRDPSIEGELSPEEKEELILIFTEEYSNKQSIDEKLDTDNRFQFIDYSNFRSEFMKIEKAKTNLNTIYE